MTNTPTKKDVDDLVYTLRQKGDDSTYALVVEALAKWGTPLSAPDCHHRPPCDECAALAAQGGK